MSFKQNKNRSHNLLNNNNTQLGAPKSYLIAYLDALLIYSDHAMHDLIWDRYGYDHSPTLNDNR
jgi:hypothetical protein